MSRKGRASGPRTSHPPLAGDWTSQKLRVLASYLTSYTTALKDQPTRDHSFRKGYIDGFAGTGYRDVYREEAGPQAPLFPDLADADPQALLDGSARIALKTEPRFDRYVFIERSAQRCAQLDALRSEFPDLANDIHIQQGDANDEIRTMCAKDWRAHRAVMFLDAFGMQVEWRTLEAIAHTRAIDLWLLFPLGMGVNRLLTKSGDIPLPWRHRLNVLLGTQAWSEDLYRVETEPTLFGNDQERVVKATTATIGRYFNDRLKSIFAGVSAEPGVLRNSKRNPLYLLCFAVGNDRGKDLALRIANHLLKELR